MFDNWHCFKNSKYLFDLVLDNGKYVCKNVGTLLCEYVEKIIVTRYYIYGIW